MRKPRDFDAELKALEDKAKRLKEQKLRQLGELVAAIGADALPTEQLAGALLAAVEADDLVTREDWRKRGAAFFQGKAPSPGGGAGRNAPGDKADRGGAASAAPADRAS
jgi:hypothetical protein